MDVWRLKGSYQVRHRPRIPSDRQSEQRFRSSFVAVVVRSGQQGRPNVGAVGVRKRPQRVRGPVADLRVVVTRQADQGDLGLRPERLKAQRRHRERDGQSHLGIAMGNQRKHQIERRRIADMTQRRDDRSHRPGVAFGSEGGAEGLAGPHPLTLVGAYQAAENVGPQHARPLVVLVEQLPGRFEDVVRTVCNDGVDQLPAAFVVECPEGSVDA